MQASIAENYKPQDAFAGTGYKDGDQWDVE
jgi:hypothetical protein